MNHTYNLKWGFPWPFSVASRGITNIGKYTRGNKGTGKGMGTVPVTSDVGRMKERQWSDVCFVNKSKCLCRINPCAQCFRTKLPQNVELQQLTVVPVKRKDPQERKGFVIHLGNSLAEVYSQRSVESNCVFRIPSLTSLAGQVAVKR